MILYLHCLRRQSHREDEFKTCFKRDTVPCVINQRVYHCTCLTLMIIKKAEKSQLQVFIFFSSFPFIFFKWYPTNIILFSYALLFSVESLQNLFHVLGYFHKENALSLSPELPTWLKHASFKFQIVLSLVASPSENKYLIQEKYFSKKEKNLLFPFNFIHVRRNKWYTRFSRIVFLNKKSCSTRN